MGRITGTTKEIVRKYYKEKTDKLKEQLKVIENKYIDDYFKKFENDKDVIKARELIEKINKKYEINEKIELYRYRIDYQKSEEYKEVLTQIRNINKECDILLVTLDNLPLRSKEYIQALKQLNKILNEVK